MQTLVHILFYLDLMQMKICKFACFYLENELISKFQGQKKG